MINNFDINNNWIFEIIKNEYKFNNKLLHISNIFKM